MKAAAHRCLFRFPQFHSFRICFELRVSNFELFHPMDFDWIDVPFDLKKITPKEIEESFEDPFSLRLLPDGVEGDAKARYFNLGKSIGDRGFFFFQAEDGI